MIVTRAVYTDTVLRFACFGSASKDFVSQIKAEAQILNEPKGKILFLSGDTASRFYVIHSGFVKIFSETKDGGQAVLNILGENEIFGENSLFNNGKYTYCAEVVEPSMIISCPLSALKDELERNQEVSWLMMQYFAQRQTMQDQEIEHRVLMNASQRIGCYILSLSGRASTGNVKVELPFDKTLVAAKLGMQPETFSRALTKLKNETGLIVRGGTIEVQDVSALVKYCCSACSNDFPCNK